MGWQSLKSSQSPCKRTEVPPLVSDFSQSPPSTPPNEKLCSKKGSQITSFLRGRDAQKPQQGHSQQQAARGLEKDVYPCPGSSQCFGLDGVRVSSRSRVGHLHRRCEEEVEDVWSWGSTFPT